MTVWYKYPHTSMHDMDLDWILAMIKELKEKVDQMDMETILSRLDQIDTALGALETDNVQIKADLRTAQVLIQALRTDLTSDETRISSIEDTLSNIDVILEPLAERVSDLSADVGAMQSQVSSNTERIVALESAEFEPAVVSDYNFLQANDIQHLDNFDYEIRRLDGSDSTPDAIQIVSGYIRFFTDASYNPCALIIKNALVYTPGLWSASNIVSFGLKYRLTGSYSGQNGTDYSVSIPFTSLIATSPYIAPTGSYTESRGTLRVTQFKLSEDGKSYDLWIYNNYNYQYRCGNIVDIYAIAGVFKNFSGWSMANIKSYWAQVYGETGAQIGGLIKKHTPGIVSQAVAGSKTYTDAQISTAITQMQTYADDHDQNTIIANSFCRWNSSADEFFVANEIEDVFLTEKIVSTPSNTMEIMYNGQERTLTTCLVMVKGFIELTSGDVVNQGGSFLDLGYFDFNLSGFAPDTVQIIPTCPNLGLANSPYFSDLRVDTAGHLLYRLSFDDTNFDWNSRSVAVPFNGIVQFRKIL